MAVRAQRLKDGPLPAHYEPRESPFANALYKTQTNPTLREFPSPLNQLAIPRDPIFPIIATTYRLTEHYLSGPMSRFNSWLNELQPEMFVELSPELAGQRGIEHGGWMVVSTPRGEIEARAMVTHRIKPLTVARADHASDRTSDSLGLRRRDRRRDRQRSHPDHSRSQRQYARGQGLYVRGPRGKASKRPPREADLRRDSRARATSRSPIRRHMRNPKAASNRIPLGLARLCRRR